MDKKIKITKENLIRRIVRETGKNISEVKDFYNVLEENIFELLSSANDENNVCIKLFEGISLDGTYLPEKIKKNNLTGETSFVNSKIKPKFNITRSYIEKLNNK